MNAEQFAQSKYLRDRAEELFSKINDENYTLTIADAMIFFDLVQNCNYIRAILNGNVKLGDIVNHLSRFDSALATVKFILKKILANDAFVAELAKNKSFDVTVTTTHPVLTNMIKAANLKDGKFNLDNPLPTHVKIARVVITKFASYSLNAGLYDKDTIKHHANQVIKMDPINDLVAENLTIAMQVGWENGIPIAWFDKCFPPREAMVNFTHLN